MARKLPTLDAQKVATAEAKRRIKIAIDAAATEISFQDLTDLTEIPSAIGKLEGLLTLSLEDTSVSDLSPIAPLVKLMSLDIDDTLVLDLAPLASLQSLFSLYASGTLIDDLTPLSKLKKLMSIRIGGTAVADISPLSSNPNIRHLSLTGTKVSDITKISLFSDLRSLDLSNTAVSDVSPLKDLKHLAQLDISGTMVSDISPLSSLERLFNPFGASGITFNNCKGLPTEILDLSSRKNPGRSIEVGRILGLSADPSSDTDDEPIEDSILVQRPAPYSFVWEGEKIEALPHQQSPFNDDLAADIQQIVRDKLENALSSLTGNQIDDRLKAALQSALLEVSREPADIRDGILLMRLRTVQAVSAAYFSSDAEYDEGVRVDVMDAALSLEDLLAVYPGARTIDANRQALNFQASGRQLDDYIVQAKEIVALAEQSDIVDSSAIAALRDGAEEIDLLGELISTTSNEVTRASAIEKRASLASLQLLGIRNFVVAPLRKVVDELGPVAGDSWKQIKLAIPLGVGDGVRSVVSGSIKAGAAALATMLAGPVAGIAVLATSFVPLAKTATKIAEAVDSDPGSESSNQTTGPS